MRESRKENVRLCIEKNKRDRKCVLYFNPKTNRGQNFYIMLNFLADSM